MKRCNCLTYRFDGDACNVPRVCKPRRSRSDDCLLREAGVGKGPKGSGLVFDSGVGSAGRDGFTPLRGSSCNPFGAWSSPLHQLFIDRLQCIDTVPVSGLTDSKLTTEACS